MCVCVFCERGGGERETQYLSHSRSLISYHIIIFIQTNKALNRKLSFIVFKTVQNGLRKG